MADAGATWPVGAPSPEGRPAETDGAYLEVSRCGPLTTVQDAGRHGLAHLGVGSAGALDRSALELGNRLVGNQPGAAVLEATLGGLAFTVRASHAVALAVTGAPVEVRLDGMAAPWQQGFVARPGQEVVLGAPPRGVRCYLCVGGGIEVPAVLASRSADTLSGLGPPPLANGARVMIGASPSSVPAADVVVSQPIPDALLLELVPGPRWELLEPAAVRNLRHGSYTVTCASSRVALRLEGPPLATRGSELPSEAVVWGALQVPRDGQPLIFLNDHPTTGGYPVVGVVPGRYATQCAQARPGVQVRFAIAAAPWATLERRPGRARREPPQRVAAVPGPTTGVQSDGGHVAP